MTPYALVTGASRGIGAAFARLLAEEDHPLILTARTEGDLAAVAEEIRQSRGSRTEIPIVLLAEDLSVPGGAERLIETVRGRSLEVDLLVNNAGFGEYAPFLRQSHDRLVRMQTLNMIAPTVLSHALVAPMIERCAGAILNVASTSGFQPTPGMAVYGATKAYLVSFTEALAVELEGTNVSVTVLCPGPTKTSFMEVAGMKPTLNERMFEAPDVVAKRGLEALRRRQTVCVSGASNWVGAQAARLLPRSAMARLAGAVIKKSLGGEDDGSAR